MKKRIKMKEDLYPEFSDQLIKRLVNDFPDRLPDKQISDFDLGFKIGQQSIIKKLKFEYNKFENDSPFED